MRSRGLILLVVTLLAPALLLVAAPTPAYAEGCPPGTEPGSAGGGTICIPVTDPGGGGGGGGGGGDGGGGGGGGGTRVCRDASGAEIPCTDDYGGSWDPGRGCYAFKLVPQPPADSPLWRGHTPDEGSIWSCDHTVSILETTWFVPNGEEQPPDPGQLARHALGLMHLAVPQIHLSPPAGTPSIVGLETWLWMDAEQWAPLSMTVTVRTTSVTVTAAPVRTTWDLTEDVVTCDSAGTAWSPGAAAPDCSYTFLHPTRHRPGGEYPLSATLTYQVDWTCTGACLSGSGTLGEVDGLAGTGAVRVNEIQALVTSVLG